MNDKQLLFGQYSQLKAFWIDADPGVCRDDAMSTTILKIKNGEVIESQCKPNTASANDATDDNVVDDKNDETSTMAATSTMAVTSIYKCTDDWIKYDNRKIDQGGDKHNQRFSTLEEAKAACIQLPIDDCIGIGEHRVKANPVVFYLRRFSKLTNNMNNPQHASYIRPKCEPDG